MMRMVSLKKRFVCLLALLLLTVSCAAAEEETPVLCGAVFFSGSMGGDWSLLEERRHLDAVLYGLGEDWYDVAMDVPDERVVDIRGGRELYLILPMDADAAVSVVYLGGEEESVVYDSETGEPFLLRCNAASSPWEEDLYLSDFEDVREPFDCRILIEDSMDNMLIWNPYIHFNRGEMNTDAQGGYVIDFTNYE